MHVCHTRYVCMYACMHVCMHACMYMSVCVCVEVPRWLNHIHSPFMQKISLFHLAFNVSSWDFLKKKLEWRYLGFLSALAARFELLCFGLGVRPKDSEIWSSGGKQQLLDAFERFWVDFFRSCRCCLLGAACVLSSITLSSSYPDQQ